jgi:hypothetical protein
MGKVNAGMRLKFRKAFEHEEIPVAPAATWRASRIR